jgi:outer membrane protein OmpA-like peptidoglycan-associated protein
MPSLGLPVTAEQRTLDQIYARNLAAQSSSHLPVAGQRGFAPLPSTAESTAGPSPSVIINGNARPIATTAFSGYGATLMVKFAHGGAGLSSRAKAQLKAFAPRAVGHPGIVRVVGHASQRTGNMSFGRHLAANFNVSVDRANAVALELTRLGVDPARLLVEAVGDAQPRFHETMPSGESENRRVEIFLE